MNPCGKCSLMAEKFTAQAVRVFYFVVLVNPKCVWVVVRRHFMDRFFFAAILNEAFK